MKNLKGFFSNTRNLLGFGEEAPKAKAVLQPRNAMEKEEKKVLNLQSIREEIVGNFKFQLEDNSFDNCILFPMVATVILNEKDFEKRRE